MGKKAWGGEKGRGNNNCCIILVFGHLLVTVLVHDWVKSKWRRNEAWEERRKEGKVREDGAKRRTVS